MGFCRFQIASWLYERRCWLGNVSLASGKSQRGCREFTRGWSEGQFHIFGAV